MESELGWLFREQTEDYGIDAQVEVVDDETVRGKLLALQIKSGLSLFRETAPGGWWFRPKVEHVNYWTNHSLPVAVILFHPATKRCHWQLVNAGTLTPTPRGGWKILVPEMQILDRNAQVSLREAADGITVPLHIDRSLDHAGQLGSNIQNRKENEKGEHASNVVNIEITPSPRLLNTLTRVSAAPWICIAEIIEGAYNAKIKTKSKPAPLQMSIALPSFADETKTLALSDNSVGMDFESLLTSARQGFTWIQDKQSVGLFLMLMRLGSRFTLRTSRAGDTAWIELSFDLMTTEGFTARACRVGKDEPKEHGTRIEINDLHSDQWEAPKQRKLLRERLGDCFSYLLKNGQLTITVNDEDVLDRRPCAWDASRVVVRNGTPVSAVQEINLELSVAWTCVSCGFQHDWLAHECAECLGENLVERPRRIWGWLGIQRYLDRSDYGIDFLRNGRKILYRDKRLFTWIDPFDSSTTLEYPIELPMAGRIIGEIHCDHVAVNLLKNEFDYDSVEWQEVVHAIRGHSPLSPRRCAELGYARNESPLALLFSAFRRNDPGARCLIPGNGRAAIHETARAWATRFRNGDARFQTDQIWYEAALSHDEIKIQ